MKTPLMIIVVTVTLACLGAEQSNTVLVLSLRGSPMPEFRPYEQEDDNAILNYRTIKYPVLITLNKEAVTYQREDGIGFYHPTGAVVIKDEVIRFGGNSTVLSFFTHTPLGMVTYHFNLESSVMTKVETQLQLPAGKETGGRTAVIVTQFLCSRVSPKPKTATSDLIWSESPGAFEQQLKRRHNNPLFPKELRTITQVDIALAITQDVKDYERLRERLVGIAAEIGQLPERVSPKTLMSLRERIDDSIQELAGVGGRASDLVEHAKALRRSIISALEGAGSAASEALTAAEKFYHEGAAKWEIPFVAQMLLEQGPIPPDELIYSLLSESPDTITLVLSWLPQSLRQDVLTTANESVETAIHAGGERKALEAKLRAIESFVEKSKEGSLPRSIQPPR